MQSKYIRLFAMTTTLALALAACQMETSPLKDGGIKESVETQQPALQNPQQPEVQNPQQEDKAPTNDFSNNGIVLGVTQVQVQFDPDTGSLHYPDGSSNSNPINLLLTTGYTVSRPQATPYRAGYKFRGWVQSYPYPEVSFGKDDFWDFDTDILTEGMTLYAFFEEPAEGEEPDEMPESVVQQPTTNYPSSYLYEMNVTEVPDISSFADKRNADGRYELFARDVSRTSGWLNNVQYKNHCWATSSSQMIYWYQNQIEKLAGFNSDETPVQTDDKVLELRDWFGSRHDLKGYHIRWALDEYFTANYPARKGDIISYHCPNKQYFTLETLSKILLKHLGRGDMCGLTAVNFDGGLHAMNIYGAEFNSEGIAEVLYVTSSPTLDDEGVKNHKPQLYKFYQDGYSWEGAQSWKATYDISKDGYTSTSEISIQNIYRLDFLTVESYK